MMPSSTPEGSLASTDRPLPKVCSDGDAGRVCEGLDASENSKSKMLEEVQKLFEGMGADPASW